MDYTIYEIQSKPVYNVNGERILPTSRNPLSLLDTFKYIFKEWAWFKFVGRADREEFIKVQIILQIPVLLVGIGAIFSGVYREVFGSVDSVAVFFLLVFVFFVSAFIISLGNMTACVRRLHDMGRSGWWVLLSGLPFFHIWLLSTEGQQGVNKYGLPTDYVDLKGKINPEKKESYKTISIVGDSNSMSFLETMKSFSFSWKGRADRREFIYTSIGILLPTLIIFQMCSSLEYLTNLYFLTRDSYLSLAELVIYENIKELIDIVVGFNFWVAILSFIIAGISVLVRRFHDTNRSAWALASLLLMPLPMYWSLVSRSVNENNQYGESTDYKQRKEQFLCMPIEQYVISLIEKASPLEVELTTADQISYIVEQLGRLRDVGLAYCALLHSGSHRAYLDNPGMSFAFQMTLGGLGIWFLIDLFRVPAMVEEYNREKIKDILREAKEAFPNVV